MRRKAEGKDVKSNSIASDRQGAGYQTPKKNDFRVGWQMKFTVRFACRQGPCLNPGKRKKGRDSRGPRNNEKSYCADSLQYRRVKTGGVTPGPTPSSTRKCGGKNHSGTGLNTWGGGRWQWPKKVDQFKICKMVVRTCRIDPKTVTFPLPVKTTPSWGGNSHLPTEQKKKGTAPNANWRYKARAKKDLAKKSRLGRPKRG